MILRSAPVPVFGPARSLRSAFRVGPRRPAASALLGLKLVVATLVVLQRFVVPGTDVSVALPVVLVVVAVLAARGDVRADPLKFGLYTAAMCTALLADVLSSGSGNPWASTNSLLLLVVIYLPLCCQVSPRLRPDLPEVLEFFQKLMVVAAGACVMQWAAQVAGWQFKDVLDVVPADLLASPLEFNLSYPLYYGSSIYKANGVVFLEASFASQFLALAIIVELLLAGLSWRIALYGAGLLATLSGTGLLLLAAGLVVVAIRRGGRWAVRAAVSAALAVVVVGLTPVGGLLAERTNETAQQGSSGNQRFVAPYGNVLTAVANDPSALTVGRGAGSVDRDTDFFSPLGVDANYPAVPKMLGEYGLPATLVFFAFLLAVFLRGVPSPTLAAAALLLFLVLSSALLQPPIVYLCWLVTGLFSASAERPRPVRPAPGRALPVEAG